MTFVMTFIYLYTYYHWKIIFSILLKSLGNMYIVHITIQNEKAHDNDG